MAATLVHALGLDVWEETDQLRRTRNGLTPTLGNTQGNCATLQPIVHHNVHNMT